MTRPSVNGVSSLLLGIENRGERHDTCKKSIPGCFLFTLFRTKQQFFNRCFKRSVVTARDSFIKPRSILLA